MEKLYYKNQEVKAVPGDCCSDDCIFDTESGCRLFKAKRFEQDNGLKSCCSTGVVYKYVNNCGETSCDYR